MGVNAYFNGVAQFEMMMPYINDGDVFIHAPEASAPQQLMYSTAMYSVAKNGDIDSRLYSAVEENYDLFTSVDIRNVTKTFDAFTYYNDGRRDLPAKSYTDYIDKIKLSDGYYYTDTGYIDNRGNYAVPLPAGGTNAITGEADIVTDYITDYTSVMRLNGYYGKLRARGAKVFLINAAVNEDILDKRINEADFSRFEKYPHRGAPIQESTVEDWVNAYDSVERKNITISCILSLKDCLYPSEYFSNSDYHLSSDGREIHTAKIIDALSKVL
jgi:signal peptidase I